MIAIVLAFCNCNKSNQKGLKFGAPVKMWHVDTTGDGVADTWGYFINEPGNFRPIYEEIDKNLDGHSDEFIWAGSAVYSPKNRPEREVVKVHEESDQNNDGKIDTIKWLLPNEFFAMGQLDEDNDGFFETTTYYNIKKQIVRKEKDTDHNGKPDVILWTMIPRVEVDSNSDGIPDKFKTAKSNLELESVKKDSVGLLPLAKSDSWYLNQNKVPQENRALIGSGMFDTK